MTARSWSVGTVAALAVAAGTVSASGGGSAIAAPASGHARSSAAAIAAGQPRPAVHVAPAAAVGHLAYLTDDQHVLLVSVTATGSTSFPDRIGPISHPKGKKESVFVGELTSSGDGRRLAWSESVTRKTNNGQDLVRELLVIRNMRSGKMVHLRSSAQPIGFAGHRLLVTTATKTKRVALSPSPHLRTVHTPGNGLAAYPRGVVNVHSRAARHGRTVQKLRLTTLHGHSTRLHTYRLGKTNYRYVDQAWTSRDGSRTVVERGNHQDFDGLGPSSLADQYKTRGHHHRKTLGHYGTGKAGWRIQDVSYAGAHDKVWAAWTAAGKHHVRTVVARSGSHHSWKQAQKGMIAVAGNSSGFVVIQPGRYLQTAFNPYHFLFQPVATDSAMLVRGGTTHTLNADGTSFVWVVVG